MTKKYDFDKENCSFIKEGVFWLDGTIAGGNNHREICEELNTLDEEINRQKERVKIKKEQLSSLRELNTLLFDMIDGMIAYKKLQDLGYYFDDE